MYFKTKGIWTSSKLEGFALKNKGKGTVRNMYNDP